MGIVFKAHDAELNRPLAIKILAPHLANHGPARKRFAQEARSAAGVLHPNVIAVHDVNNEGKTPFIVMPYIAGSSLEALIDKNGPMDEIEIVRIALQIAAGLTPAHAQGLVHRDIKPANILVEHGANRVIITDFGLARAEDDASMTRTGWLTGTPNYMSPEQTRGDKLDNRSDLFSLGSLLYYLATGRLPFRADSPLGVLNRIQNDEPTKIRTVNSRISSTLAGIIHVLLSKDAGHRYQSAGELHDVLEQHLAHLHQPEIAKPPKVKKAGGNSYVGYWASAIAILLLAATVTGGMFLYGFWEQPQNVVQWQLVGPFANSDDGSESLPAAQEESRIVAADSNALSVTVMDSPTRLAKTDTPFDDEIYRVISSIKRNDDGHKEFNEGMQAHQNGKFDLAIKLFTEAAKHDSYRGIATYNIGCGYALKGDKEKAFEYLEKAIGLGFTDFEQFENDEDLDLLRADSERFGAMLERLETMNEAISLLSNAQGFINSRSWDSAIELLRESVKLDETNPEAVFYLGYALHMNDELDEALKWHQAAAKTKAKAALGNYNIACIYAMREDADKAIKHLELAMDAGLTDFLDSKRIKNDEDFLAIKDDERFIKIVEEVADFAESHMGSYFQVRQGSNDFMEVISADWRQEGKVQGDFEIWLRGDRVRVSLNQSSKERELKWSYSTEYDIEDFEPRLTRESTEFTLKRRQGTVRFDGKFKKRKGTGSFEFVPEAKYVASLKSKGIKNPQDDLLFRLFMSNEDEEQFVKNLQRLQGLDLGEKTLNILMVHNVKADLVERYQDALLDADDHLVFLIWRVSPKLIKAYNDAGLDLNQYKSFINRRVEPKLIKAYLDAGLDLKKNERFVTWRVEPRLLQRYEAASLDLEENKEFIQMRVEPKLLQGYQNAGLELDKFRDLISSRVEPRQLKNYIAAGIDPDRHRDLLRSRIPAKLLTSYQNAGLEIKKMGEYLQARVPAKEIQSYEKAGLLNKKYKKLLVGRVPAVLVRSYLKNDYDPAKLEKLIHSRVSVELLKKYEAAGLDLNKHEDFIINRMEPKKVLKYLQSIEKD